jgi:hypothetical protein
LLSIPNFMWEAIIAMKQAEMAAFEEKCFNDCLAKASPETRIIMQQSREKARKEATEERRHREIVDAIRATKPSATSQPIPAPPPSSGLLPFALGMIIGAEL